jgi:ATP-binding cassette, subfamily C (CFTR/MRP), member 4
LLDDPLSAVDAHVGRHLFDDCITGFLKDKAVLLVTHQLQYLTQSSEILILNNVINWICVASFLYIIFNFY